MAMTSDEQRKILGNVRCGDFDFCLTHSERRGVTTLHVSMVCRKPPGDQNTFTRYNGRKWLLSSHMTASELVQTALMAVLAFNEHETREMFEYCGMAIFGPHFDVADLVVLAKTNGQGGARPD